MAKKKEIPEYALDENGVLRKVEPLYFKKPKSEYQRNCYRLFDRIYRGMNRQKINTQQNERRSKKDLQEINKKRRQNYLQIKDQNNKKRREKRIYVKSDLIKGEILKQKEKNKYYKNRDENLKKAKQYQKTHRNKINNRKKIYYQNNPIKKFADSIRQNMNYAFKNNKHYKTQQCLGCSFQQFMKYIQSKFKNGMTFQNRGKSIFSEDGELLVRKWQLDHIISLASVYNNTNLNDQQKIIKIKELCHYTNYQPLWQDLNIKKGDMSPEEWQKYKKDNNIEQ